MVATQPAVKSVAVFCASSIGNRPEFERLARRLGEHLADQKVTIIFGGSDVGLMGVVADAALSRGGHVVGVYPKDTFSRDVQHAGPIELRTVSSMHERKSVMFELADAAVALPGGFGTLDELFEALTLIQTNKIAKRPVVLVGKEYWSGMTDWIKKTMLDAEQNISPADLDLFRLVDTPEEAVEYIEDFFTTHSLTPNF